MKIMNIKKLSNLIALKKYQGQLTKQVNEFNWLLTYENRFIRKLDNLDKKLINEDLETIFNNNPFKDKALKKFGEWIFIGIIKKSIPNYYIFFNEKTNKFNFMYENEANMLLRTNIIYKNEE